MYRNSPASGAEPAPGNMTTRSATIYGVGGVLLVACLAAANMPQEREAPPERSARVPRSASPDEMAVEVSSQATRLHSLMAQAPTPGSSVRNPFSFAAARAPRSDAPLVHAATIDEPPAILPSPLPALTLMGVAEETTPAGPRRTAVVGGDGDTIYMVGEGDAVGERYRVKKIGADAIELEDVVTKAYRRLALR